MQTTFSNAFSWKKKIICICIDSNSIVIYSKSYSSIATMWRVSCQKGPTRHAYACRIGPILAGYPRISQHLFGKWISFKHKASHYLRQWWCSSVMHICIVRPQQIKWGSVSASVVSVLFCKKILIHFNTFSIGILNNENSYSGETDEHVYTVTNPSWMCIGIQYICCPSYGNH